MRTLVTPLLASSLKSHLRSICPRRCGHIRILIPFLINADLFVFGALAVVAIVQSERRPPENSLALNGVLSEESNTIFCMALFPPPALRRGLSARTVSTPTMMASYSARIFRAKRRAAAEVIHFECPAAVAILPSKV